MTPATVLRRLRWFLLAMALLLFVGTLVELWLVGHTEDAVQWVPFALCALGLVTIFVTMFARGRKSSLLLRACMFVVIAGSAFGVYQHVSNNVAFEREINPSAAGRQLILKGLSGANPLLAPATLGVAALLALAATYKDSVD